ncbi:MAG: ATP-binding cassette domain-containing protein [Clostridiales bacterium]|nr:ATP-binding cassette domain-containing protein [Clostridiales bacterium]
MFRRRYVTVEALKNVSLRVERGSIVGLLGPNGAGKSTLIKILTGVMHPTSGSAEVLGYIPWKQRARYVEHIGAVFGQKSQLIWDIPPVDAYRMNKEIYAIPNEVYKKRLGELTELFDVAEVSRKPTRVLSLGERMKCEFIMALLHGPEIVFLDEPTIGLDVIAKSKVRDCVTELNKHGVTFILTTHDMDDVESLAERVVVINHGEIGFDGSLTELRHHLGDKKLVRITTETPLKGLNSQSLQLISRPSEFEAVFELSDPSKGLDSLMHELGKINGITDIAIEAPPIEEVIKTFYEAYTT